MIKGACPGVKRRVITLRKSLFPQTKRSALEVRGPALRCRAVPCGALLVLLERERFQLEAGGRRATAGWNSQVVLTSTLFLCPIAYM